MVKKPTLVALSSLVALSVPTVSEKLSTSEMRKNSIKPNAVELNGDAQKDIPVTEPAKQPTLASDPDLITVELSQDGTSTVIKNDQQAENKLQNNKKDDFIPEPKMVGSSKLDITKVELLSKKVLIPSLPEQQAIGAYFSNLDNLIASHQEKISQLETLKKKLLQDMFI